MAYSPRVIANYFIDRAREEGQEITPMKLIKLVYFAHGWHLGLFHEPLISEDIMAWQFGLVVETLYHSFKRFGNKNITEKALVIPSQEQELKQDAQSLAVLDGVWKAYSKFTGVQLSNLTHEKNSPWDRAWQNDPSNKYFSCPIDNKIIEEHFALEANKQ